MPLFQRQVVEVTGNADNIQEVANMASVEGSLIISDSILTEVALPLLKQVSALCIKDNDELTSVDLSGLRNCDDVTIENCPKLARVTLGAIGTVVNDSGIMIGGIRIKNLKAIATLVMWDITIVQSEVVFDRLALPKFERTFKKLKNVHGNLVISNCNNMSDFGSAFTELKSVGGDLRVVDNWGITDIGASFSIMKDVAGSFVFSGNVELRTLNLAFQAMRKVGWRFVFEGHRNITDIANFTELVSIGADIVVEKEGVQALPGGKVINSEPEWNYMPTGEEVQGSCCCVCCPPPQRYDENNEVLVTDLPAVEIVDNPKLLTVPPFLWLHPGGSHVTAPFWGRGVFVPWWLTGITNDGKKTPKPLALPRVVSTCIFLLLLVCVFVPMAYVWDLPKPWNVIHTTYIFAYLFLVFVPTAVLVCKTTQWPKRHLINREFFRPTCANRIALITMGVETLQLVALCMAVSSYWPPVFLYLRIFILDFTCFRQYAATGYTVSFFVAVVLAIVIRILIDLSATVTYYKSASKALLILLPITYIPIYRSLLSPFVCFYTDSPITATVGVAVCQLDECFEPAPICFDALHWTYCAIAIVTLACYHVYHILGRIAVEYQTADLDWKHYPRAFVFSEQIKMIVCLAAVMSVNEPAGLSLFMCATLVLLMALSLRYNEAGDYLIRFDIIRAGSYGIALCFSTALFVGLALGEQSAWLVVVVGIFAAVCVGVATGVVVRVVEKDRIEDDAPAVSDRPRRSSIDNFNQRNRGAAGVGYAGGGGGGGGMDDGVIVGVGLANVADFGVVAHPAPIPVGESVDQIGLTVYSDDN